MTALTLTAVGLLALSLVVHSTPWWHRRFHADHRPGARLIPCDRCFNDWLAAFHARNHRGPDWSP